MQQLSIGVTQRSKFVPQLQFEQSGHALATALFKASLKSLFKSLLEPLFKSFATALLYAAFQQFSSWWSV